MQRRFLITAFVVALALSVASAQTTGGSPGSSSPGSTQTTPGTSPSGTPGMTGTPSTTGNPGSINTPGTDRKSTRLNSSHANISYAVFCLKKKKINSAIQHT